jgi:translation initiation factor 4E
MDPNQKLPINWSIWYHQEKDNWKLSGYKKMYDIKTPKDFWKLYNNWNKIKGVNYKHYFIIRENVTPIWEDTANINGGCWSFKISEEMAPKLWEDLSIYLVCNQITQNDDIIGLSLCLKKNNNTVIKIWNKDSKKNSLNLINKNIIKKWGTDIIYIAHMPEN